MPKLDLVVQHNVVANVPFSATVAITEGESGGIVRVTLRQVRGIPPRGSWGPLTITLDAVGAGDAPFAAIQVSGPTTATLIATANDDVGGFYEPDAESVLVQP